TLTLFGAALLFASVSATVKADQQKKGAPAQPAVTAPAAPSATQPTPEQAAKMAEMQKLTSPGENHKRLDKMVGNWTHTIKRWMKPGDQPTSTTGTDEIGWMLDGRFLKQKTKGEWMGKPFEGVGVTGYDNIRQEYTTIWMDNMSTGMMHGTAQYDATKKIL